MKNLIFVLSILFAASFLFTSCEKEKYEITRFETGVSQSTFDSTMWVMQQQINGGFSQAAAADSAYWAANQGNWVLAFGYFNQLLANDVITHANQDLYGQYIIDLVGVANGNQVWLEQVWTTVNAMQGDVTAILALQNLFATQISDVYTELLSVGADVSGLQTMMGQMLPIVIGLEIQMGTLQSSLNDANSGINQLINTVDNIELVNQLILAQTQQNGADIQANGTALAIVNIKLDNIEGSISDVFTAVNQGNLNDIQITGMIDGVLDGIDALGVNVNSNHNQLMTEISALNASSNAHGTMLAILMTKVDNLTDVANLTFDHVVDLGLGQAALTTTLNGVTIGLANFSAEFNAWKIVVLGEFADLNLEVAQQGQLLATLTAYAQDIIASQADVTSMIAGLQLSVDGLHDLELAQLDHLIDIKADIANLQGTADGLVSQHLMLSDAINAGFTNVLNAINDGLCCATCGNNTNPPANIVTTIVNTFNEYVYTDNSINVGITNNMVYNACANTLGTCPSGPNSPTVVNGVDGQQQVCFITNAVIPVIQGNDNIINFGNMESDYSTVQDNWNVDQGSNCD